MGPGAENWGELEKQQSFKCLVEQAQKDVLEVEPFGWKVDPVEIEFGLSALKVELVGCWVVLAQLRVVLTDQTTKWTGYLLDLIRFEAGQFSQILDHIGHWVGLAKRKVDQLAQKDNLAGHQVDLVVRKVVWDYQKVEKNR